MVVLVGHVTRDGRLSFVVVVVGCPEAVSHRSYSPMPDSPVALSAQMISIEMRDIEMIVFDGIFFVRSTIEAIEATRLPATPLFRLGDLGF